MFWGGPVLKLVLSVGDDVNEQEARDYLIIEESTVKNESATDDEADAMDLLDELWWFVAIPMSLIAAFCITRSYG